MNEKSKQPASELSTGAMAGLQAMISRAADSSRGLPPVDKWNPPFCGDIDMEIRADGTWFYMGTPIGRAPLVRLFSTVLRKDEDGKTCLVTPVERVGIRVVDAPFLGVEMVVTERNSNTVLTLRTNVGDVVEVGAEHPLRFELDETNGGLKPYVLVRGRLEALVTRAVMYDLVALAENLDVGGVSWLAVRSCGQVFPIIESARLEALLT